MSFLAAPFMPVTQGLEALLCKGVAKLVYIRSGRAAHRKEFKQLSQSADGMRLHKHTRVPDGTKEGSLHKFGSTVKHRGSHRNDTPKRTKQDTF